VVEQTSDECGFPVVHASGGGQPQQARHLEVSLPLTILHGGFGEPVVRSGGSTLGESTGLHLGDDLLHGGGVRFDGPGARTVTDGAVTHHQLADLLALPWSAPRTRGEPHAVAAEDRALVRVVDRGQLDALPGDVVPHVGFGPVRQREHAYVLAGAMPAVVQVPQFRSLPAWFPLPESVAETEDTFLGAGTFFVAPGPAEHGVEAMFGDGVEQRLGLQWITSAVRAFLEASVVDPVLHLRDDQP